MNPYYDSEEQEQILKIPNTNYFEMKFWKEFFFQYSEWQYFSQNPNFRTSEDYKDHIMMEERRKSQELNYLLEEAKDLIQKLEIQSQKYEEDFSNNFVLNSSIMTEGFQVITDYQHNHHSDSKDISDTLSVITDVDSNPKINNSDNDKNIEEEERKSEEQQKLQGELIMESNYI